MHLRNARVLRERSHDLTEGMTRLLQETKLSQAV